MADNLNSDDSESSEQEAKLLLTLRNGRVTPGSSRSPDRMMDNFSQDFSPLSALGLQRVGEERPSPVKEVSNIQLNRRGMPARIRKKNKMYFDDDHISSPTQVKSPKKTPKNTPKKAPPTPIYLPPSPSIQPSPSPVPTPVKMEPSSSITTPDKKVAQQNGVRLRNFLKLPQAHKWVYFEWFYSNIDKPLFEGENDFQVVLKEAFPYLKSRKLTRRQWGLIRKIMGKPRRCSQAFFQEEREALQRRRQLIRLLQQRKISDVSNLKDLALPNQIPLQLVIGTKVTSRIRGPENGLYTGVIDAVDTSDNTYRITFDRNGIGTHSIPDYEVLSSEPPEEMPLSSFAKKFRPRFPMSMSMGLVTPPRPIMPKLEVESIDSPTFSLNNDPILAQSPIKPAKLTLDDNLGGYPVRSLVEIVQISKILRIKREKIAALSDLNSEAEKIRSYGQDMTLDFQKKYASLVLEIEKLNTELNQKLVSVQHFCQRIAPDLDLSNTTLLPGQIQQTCLGEAKAIVQVTNVAPGNSEVTNESAIDLITKLTSVMLQIKKMAETDASAFELTSLQETVDDIKSSLEDSNKNVFQDKVEVHIRHIMKTVSQMGSMQAFNQSSNGFSNRTNS